MKNSRIIVTGASSGIGKALCRLLVDKGAIVFGLCRTDPKLDSVIHIPVDLRLPKTLQEAFESIGQCDVLINNAGVAYSSSIISGNLDEWETMWQVNVQSLAYACHLAIPKFPAEGGQIVNVSSMSGHRVPPSGGFYSPTKFAVKAITESLRLELKTANNLTRISSISPGFVDTPLLNTYFANRPEALAQTKKQTVMLTPEDVAYQILHILQTPLRVEIGDISMRSSSQTV